MTFLIIFMLAFGGFLAAGIVAHVENKKKAAQDAETRAHIAAIATSLEKK